MADVCQSALLQRNAFAERFMKPKTRNNGIFIADNYMLSVFLIVIKLNNSWMIIDEVNDINAEKQSPGSYSIY